MDKYLKVLENMKKQQWKSQNIKTLEQIEEFVTGNLPLQKLMFGADETKKNAICCIINKLLNYEEKPIKYYVGLPQDMYYHTGVPISIIAAKEDKLNITSDYVKIIGPKYIAARWNGLNTENLVEITGNFITGSTGVMLFSSDWFRIINKYPYITELMYQLTINQTNQQQINFEKVKKQVRKTIKKQISKPKDGEPDLFWPGKSHAKYIPEELIDSIKFVISDEKITPEQLENGEFTTFQEMINYTIFNERKVFTKKR